MKWLDNFVKRIIEKIEFKVNVKLFDFSDRLGSLEQAVNDLKDRDKSLSDDIQGLSAELKKINNRMLEYQEDFSTESRRINLKIDERERYVREDLERSLAGIVRAFEERLNVLGEKRGIVTDLLKKIAKLEGNNVNQ